MRGNYPDGVTGNEPELNGPEDFCPKCASSLDGADVCPGCGYEEPRCPACGGPGKVRNGRVTCCGATLAQIRAFVNSDYN